MIKKTIVIVLFLMLVSICVSSCFLDAIFKKGEKTDSVSEKNKVEARDDGLGNSMGNLRNLGLCDIEGDWIYCSLKGELHKVSLDGKKKTKLSDDYPMYINVFDGWVYYLNYVPEVIENIHGEDMYISAEKIYRIKTDGTDKQLLAEVSRCGIVMVIDDYIYYDAEQYYGGDYPSRTLFKMTLDGSEREEILLDSYNINIDGEWIYYVDSSHELSDYYKIKLDGTETTKVADFDRLNELSISEEYHIDLSTIKVYNKNIYAVRINYIDGMVKNGKSPLYNLSTDMKDIKKIINDIENDCGGASGFSFNVTDDFVYYGTGGSLYRADLDGANIQKIADDAPTEFIYVFNGYIILVSFPHDDQYYANPIYRVIKPNESDITYK